ncbi:MAG: rod shape-determining protein MreD [Acidimicrobiia bacterium]|nr:rod shape-determining protein MreD [Acidimicrobiia bacterium]MYF82743.1 rod shape-determining protein MreD [Acidimicrobiia bacterium]
MEGLRFLLSLLLVMAAALVQTSVFHSIRPLGASPDVVLLVVVVGAIWLKPEAAVLLGFLGGLLLDVLGSAPLGLSGLAFTVGSYITVRSRDRFDYGLPVGVMTVGGITLVTLVTNALIGTLFGEGTLGNPDIIRTLLLVPIYNMVFALGVLPLADRLFSWVAGPRRNRMRRRI